MKPFSLIASLAYLFSLVVWSFGQDDQKFRLPNNLVPREYNLMINVNMEEREYRFWGDVVITVKCEQSTNTVILHSRELTILEDRVTVMEDETALNIVGHDFDELNHLYIITLEKNLDARIIYTIHISFEAPLNIQLAGFYRSSYFDKESQTLRWIAVTQAEPIHARRIFPCFDELHFKAKFTVSIAHADRYRALTNMSVREKKPSPDRENWIIGTFEESVPMAPYLVAFALVDFDNNEITEPTLNIPYRMWARDDVIKQTQFSQEVVGKSLPFFANYFQGPYEILKLDLVSVPDFQTRGMENYGLITFGEADQLIDLSFSSVTFRMNTALTVAHYVSKQWMGDLASFKSWDSIWLKSGFANFFEKLAVSNFYPLWHVWDVEFTNSFLNALSADGLKASHKLAYDVQSVEEPVHLFDTIAYQKGSLVIRMLYIIMGQNNFQNAVIAFIDKFKYGLATQDDIWQVFTDVIQNAGILPPDTDIKAIVDTWALQRGYPLLHVTKDSQNKKITIQQESFVLNAEEGTPQEKLCWWVPITYTTSTELKFRDIAPRQWLGCNGPLTFDLDIAEQDWILVNLQYTVLCRVQYDDANWKLIKDTLLNADEFGKINSLSRGHLISDIHGLAWIGKMDYKNAFETLMYLKHEDDYLAWINGLSVLGSLRYVLSKTDIISQYLTFAKTLVEPQFLNFGNINVYPNDDPVFVQFKSFFISWACSFGASDCQQQAQNLFNEWMRSSDPDNRNPIAPPVRSTVYCLGAALGGQPAFDFLWVRFLVTNLASEKTNILRAMSCVQDENLLQKYLEWSIDPTRIRQIESQRMFTAIVRNDSAVDLAINFFLTRFDDIYLFHKGDPIALGQYLIRLYSRIITDETFQKVQDFVNSVKDRLQPAEIRLKEAVDEARDNILWQKRSYETLKTVLSELNGQ